MKRQQGVVSCSLSWSGSQGNVLVLAIDHEITPDQKEIHSVVSQAGQAFIGRETTRVLEEESEDVTAGHKEECHEDTNSQRLQETRKKRKAI